MPSKIKQFNFNGCQHLRKVVIDSGVEFEGKIDLSDTPITDKNNVFNYNVEDETPSPFKDAPDGITGKPEALKKVRLKSGTPIETQTDPEQINLNTPMSGWDKKAMELMNDNLFWFNELKGTGRKEFLEQRREDLKNFLTRGDAPSHLNNSVHILAEHLLLINEKILENAKYFDELGNIINPEMPSGTTPKKKWKDFHKFLVKEILKETQSGLTYTFRDDEETRQDIRQGLEILLFSVGGLAPPNLSDYLKTNLSQNVIDRFMNSLEATMDKDGKKYFTFADYDEDWEFGDYYDNETKNIGFKPTKKEGGGRMYNNVAISGTGEKILTALFDYWNENYSPTLNI